MQFIKQKPYNLVLIILNVLSLIFTFQIKLSLLPLFCSRFNEKFCLNLNDLISNVALGILESSLFYLIVVYYPELLKKKSTLKVIQPRLNTIVNQLNQAIHYLHSNRINTKKDVLVLLKEDFSSVDKLGNHKMNFQYKILNIKGEWVPFSSGDQTELQFFTSEKALITRIIDEIFNLPTITALDDSLIEILAELRDCLFYSGVKSFNTYNNFNLTIVDFDKDVYIYYQLFLRLKKHVQPTPLQVNTEL